MVYTIIAVVLLALVHLFGYRIRFIQGIPRSKWLSLAGGASIAYVFIHLLPELGEHQETLREVVEPGLWHEPIYLIALAGLTIFYGVERAARLKAPSSRDAEDPTDEDDSIAIFYLHIISFAVYNALIGYTLLYAGPRESNFAPLIYAFTMGLHFLVNDYGLYDHYRELYVRRGRWIAAGGIILGAVLTFVTEIGEVTIGVIYAFIAGGVVLNVLKEELPSERKSNFWAFLAGVIGYSILLLIAV